MAVSVREILVCLNLHLESLLTTRRYLRMALGLGPEGYSDGGQASPPWFDRDTPKADVKLVRSRAFSRFLPEFELSLRAFQKGREPLGR